MYNTILRWQLYAGLFCIPFVLVLSITGAIYLFKPQVEAELDRIIETGVAIHEGQLFGWLNQLQP